MTLPDTATRSEFARIIGCKPSYVTALGKAGRLVLTGTGRRVIVAESIARIEATRDPSKAGVAERHATARAAAARAASATTPAPAPGPASGHDDGTDPLDLPATGAWADRRAKALADKEEALAARALRENLIAEGQLADVGRVVGAVATIVTALRTSLEAMPDQLTPQIAATSDEARIRVLMTEHIEHLLRSASRELAKLSQPAEPDQP